MKNNGRILPPNFKHLMQVSFQRKFSLRERMQFLIGYTAVIELRIFTEHSTGKFTPTMTVRPSKELLT